MGLCGPQLIEKGQIGGRFQSTEGTEETLTAADFKTRMIVGTTPEYSAGREQRNIARGTLTPLGSIEGKKSVSIPFSAEVNTPDAFNKGAAFSNLDIDKIEFQSAGIVRVTFDAGEDVTGVVDGDYITINYATNSANNGTWPIIVVNASSDYVDIAIQDRTTNGSDETSSPAIGDIQNNLEYQWALNACGMRVYGMSRVAISNISGTFQHGEIITATSTSNATMRCIIPAASGDSYMYFEPLTGKIDTLDDTLTGGTSGATADMSSPAPEVYGYYVQPLSNCQEVATVEYQEDGYAWSARDALGNMTLTVQASQQGFFEFSLQGPRGTIGNQALTSGVTRGTEEPPVCKNADLTLDSFEPVFSQFGFDIGNTVVLRENGNAADDTGYEGARITKREPKFTLSCEHELTTVYDFFSKLDAGTKVAVEAKVGASENKQFWFFADEVEFDELPLGDLEGIRTLDITGTCTGDASDTSGDDEFEMAFIGN